MAAMKAYVFLFVLFLYCAIFTVKNLSYITSDGTYQVPFVAKNLTCMIEKEEMRMTD